VLARWNDQQNFLTNYFLRRPQKSFFSLGVPILDPDFLIQGESPSGLIKPGM
jgi:hypothetical protein